MKRNGVTVSVLAFVVVALVVLGAVGALAMQSLSAGGGTTSTQTSQPSSSTSTFDGLQLTLQVAETGIEQGSQVAVTLTDFNTLGVINSPALPANSTMEYGLNVGPCNQLPLGLGIFQGDYSAGDLPQSALLRIFEPGAYMCPVEFPVSRYSFAPNSDNVTLYGPQGSGSILPLSQEWTRADTATLNFSGYWSGQGVLPPQAFGNDSFHTFAPGVYTVAGEDVWGQQIVVHFQVFGTVTTGTETTTSPSGSGSSTVAPSLFGLQLNLSLNSTVLSPGEALGIEVSEFNTLDSVNNVTASGHYEVHAALGACENEYTQPFGIAVFQGRYDAQNVSQGTELGIFPLLPCPMFERLVTGYVFQPRSDLAVILPSSGVTPTPLTGGVTVEGVYSGSMHPVSFAPGTYTLVAADEWGALAFLYFVVT